MLIQISNPKGRLPRITEKQLPVNYAQAATNCDFRRGRWQGLKPPSTEMATIPETGAIRTIYKAGNKWACWAADVDVIKTPVENDDERILFAGSGYPKQSTDDWLASGYAPTTTRRMGVVSPDSGSSGLNITVENDGNGRVETSVAYLYVGVTAWGELSAISAISAVTDIEGGQVVRLDNFVENSLASTGNDITHFQVYRATTTASGRRAFMLIKVRPDTVGGAAAYQIATSGFTTYLYDANNDADGLNYDIGDPLPSLYWQPPPDDLEGLVLHQNAIVAGFAGQQVFLSEIGYYYAFNEMNVLDLDYDVVALGTFNESLIVATSAFPYVITGNDPKAVIQRRINYLHPCVSKRSLVTSPDGVLYAGESGLILCNGHAAASITEGLYTPSQWASLTPANLIGFWWQNRYYGFFSGTKTGIILAVNEEIPHVVDITLTNTVYGGYISPDDNALYLLTYTGAAYRIEEWEGSASRGQMTWKSGKMVTRPTNFGCAKVVGADFTGGGSITFKWYADGVLKHTQTIENADPFWLPSGYLAEAWEFQIETVLDFDWVLIAHSPEELTT